ncbi:ABC-three component system middle component 6 [Aliarcobacter butzleri]|uniref:ABC-three component system middle component 6 n=1 Tax=Aliarcobacter butzleri TaxID=28197 RepID=UPI00344D35BB
MSRYIKTHRSKDLKRSVLVISKYLINELKLHKVAKLNDIYQNLKNKLNLQQKDFIYTINFLYILGVIEYIKENDTLRYLK